MEVEIQEQERTRRGSIAAGRGAREKLPFHGAHQRKRLICPAVSRLREEIDGTTIEIVQRRKREGG